MSVGRRRALLITIFAALAAWFTAAQLCQSPAPTVYGPVFDYPFPVFSQGTGDGTITVDGSSTILRPIDLDYRPEWWVEKPIIAGGTVTVAQFADARTLPAAEQDLRDRLRLALCDREAVSLKDDEFRFEFGLLPGGQVRLFAKAVALTDGD